MQFRKDIQGLRALAFLLVFIFHLNHNWLPGGFLGVDIFFVISGYLMTNIILNDIQNKKFNYYDFLLKRIKRIVPAYCFFLIIVSIICIFLYSYEDVIATLKATLLYTTFFISNILFALEDNYFGARLNENPFLHTWSLAIEMQFYLFLPILLYIFRKHAVKILALFIILCTLYSSYQIYFLDNKNTMYYSLIARFPEFLVGGIFSQIFKRSIDFSRPLNNLLASGSLVIILVCCFFITGHSNFPGVLALLPCIATAVLLSLKNNFISEFFSMKIPIYIGELSYSLYLWHFPIMAFLRYRSDTDVLSIPQIIIVCLFTFLFAWISYQIVETKFRKVKDSVFYKSFFPSYLVIGLIFVFMPKFTESEKIPNIYAKPALGNSSNNPQKLGNPSKNDRILLIGDSHALMFKPFLDVIGKASDFSFVSLTTSSFPALPGIRREEIPDGTLQYYKTSRKFIKSTQKLISENDYIFLSISGLGTPKSEYMAIDSLAKSLRADQKLILINSFPVINKSPLRINGGFIKSSDYHFTIIDKSKNLTELKKIASSNPNVFVYNIHKGKILENPGYYNDTVAYYDRTHINIFASQKMGKEMNDDFMHFFNNIRNSKTK